MWAESITDEGYSRSGYKFSFGLCSCDKNRVIITDLNINIINDRRHMCINIRYGKYNKYTHILFYKDKNV